MPLHLPSYEFHRLKNGMTVLLVEQHSVPIVTTLIFYRAGTRYEHPGITGISHFLEHMMFKGSKRFGKGDIDSLTALHGGYNNAFTGLDYTTYFFSFASDRWSTALEIEADRMKNCLLEAEEFELEKQVILEELKMDLDSPWGVLSQRVEQESFIRHPYGFPILGLEEDLKQLTLNEMQRYYQQYYVPGNSVLVIAGDIQPLQVLERVESLFESIPCSSLQAHPVHKEPVRNQLRLIPIQYPSSVSRLLLTMPAPPATQLDYLKMQVLAKALTGGRLSRLCRQLVETKQLASSVSSDLQETTDPFLFSIYVELHSGVDPSSAARALLSALDQFRDERMGEMELARAQNQLTSDFLQDFETTFDIGFQLGLDQIIPGRSPLDSYVEMIASLEADELRECAQKWIRTDAAVLGVMTGSDPAP